MGTLIHFGDSHKLRDLIVLEPQWIIHAFRYLIRAKDFSAKYGALQAKWEEFVETGRLEIELAENIWKQDTENRFYENFELLLLLLEKLDIIARPTVIENDGYTTKQLGFYYVPCLLTERPAPELLRGVDKPDCINTPVLCFTFRDNFLPPAIFNRVVSICLGQWPVARQGQRRLLFCGCAVFEVSHDTNEDKHRMCIFFRKEKIGVRVTRYTTKGARIADPNICDKVRRTVALAVKKEFTRFHRQPEGQLEPFKYQIQCKRTLEKEVLEDGLHDIDKLIKAINTDFFCTEHTDMNDPHSASAVEMLQEWFLDKIPEDFRLCKESVLDTWVRKLPVSIKERQVDERTLSRLSEGVGRNWQFAMAQLGVSTVSLDRIQEARPNQVRLQIYDGFLKWKEDFEREHDVSPNYGMLLEAMRACLSVNIDWDVVQNVIDELVRSR